MDTPSKKCPTCGGRIIIGRCSTCGFDSERAAKFMDLIAPKQPKPIGWISDETKDWLTWGGGYGVGSISPHETPHYRNPVFLPENTGGER